MLNLVYLVGRLGLDPKLYSFHDGTVMARLRVATSSRWVDKRTGEQKEHTEWHNVVIYGSGAKWTYRELKKGMEVCIEGKMHTRVRKDGDGKKFYFLEIQAEKIFDGRDA